MNPEDQMLARIVKERNRRSRKISKFSLDDDGEEAPLLTHKGKSIDDLNSSNHVILSDDDEDGGDLEAVDTELHFGGGSFNKQAANPYGSGGGDNMADVYSTSKTELDDLIARRKMIKAERFKNKETHAEAFENMDESFKELSLLLNFRNKEKDRKERFEAKKAGTLTQDETEMNKWDKEMKTYQTCKIEEDWQR